MPSGASRLTTCSPTPGSRSTTGASGTSQRSGCTRLSRGRNQQSRQPRAVPDFIHGRAGARCPLVFVGVADLVVFDLIQRRLGHPFQRFARLEPLYYLGSPESVPVYVDAPAYRARLSKTDPAMHDILFAGKGLEASVAAPDWAVVLPSLTAWARSENSIGVFWPPCGDGSVEVRPGAPGTRSFPGRSRLADAG